MWKKHKLVLLLTDKASHLVLNTLNNRLMIDDDKSLVERILSNYGRNMNLYLLSDEKIEDKDWIVDIPNKKLEQVNKFNLHTIDDKCKKIIATSDKDLKIWLYEDSFIRVPQFPQSFINHYIAQYNNGNIIKEVEVEYSSEFEYEVFAGKSYSYNLKINSDNTINIKPIKDSWSREEVILF